MLLRKEPYLSDLKTPDLLRDVGSRCRGFMIKMCQEIKKRYDFNDPLFEMISRFGPDEILKPRSRDLLPSLVDLVVKVPRIFAEGDLQTLDNEWRALDTSVIPEHIRNFDSTRQGPVYFYQELAKVEFDSQFLFKNLSTFALRLLALPISNADAERLFSRYRNIKTDNRNRLSAETVRALLLIKDAVREQEACYEFQPTPEMLDL